MRRSKRKFKRKPREVEKKPWVPRTELGKLVQTDKIASLDDLWKSGKRIREAEIVEHFLGEALEDRVIKIGRGGRPFRWVQRMTDSGRRNKYLVLVAVGNKNGYVGLGEGRAKEYGTAIEQALRRAKLNVIKVARGCGSWQCGCDDTHSIAYKVEAGLSVNRIACDILELAGIKDVWSETKGHTKTKTNMANATFDALRGLREVKV
jgi:small subunit ribosomal protein S5